MPGTMRLFAPLGFLLVRFPRHLLLMLACYTEMLTRADCAFQAKKRKKQQTGKEAKSKKYKEYAWS
jgi:hypothetical protein